jgi:DNA-directed RNA polymerase alpha subunit
MDKLNQLKDNIKLANKHLSECEKICNKIKRLLIFKGIKKNDVDIYIDNWDSCISISYCLSEMNIEEALDIMEANGYITAKDFGFES